MPANCITSRLLVRRNISPSLHPVKRAYNGRMCYLTSHSRRAKVTGKPWEWRNHKVQASTHSDALYSCHSTTSRVHIQHSACFGHGAVAGKNYTLCKPLMVAPFRLTMQYDTCMWIATWQPVSCPITRATNRRTGTSGPGAKAAGADLTEMFWGAEYFSSSSGDVLATVGVARCLCGIMVSVRVQMTCAWMCGPVWQLHSNHGHDRHNCSWVKMKDTTDRPSTACGTTTGHARSYDLAVKLTPWVSPDDNTNSSYMHSEESIALGLIFMQQWSVIKNEFHIPTNNSSSYINTNFPLLGTALVITLQLG